MKLVIQGRLPGLNEYITAERRHRQQAAALKRQAEQAIGWEIRAQLKGKRFERPVVMRYRWVEPNRKRDKDNIAFAKKFIQDALVQCGTLKNDGWREIVSFSDAFDVDAKHPRVEVEIEEVI